MPKNRSIIQLIFRIIIRLNIMQKGHHIDSWYAASVPTPTFPGGTLLRWPGLVLAMAWYAMLDRL